jgi:signal transduction histidine kinase
MKEQILIVEDEQDTAELLRYNLEQSGYRAVRARNGEEAIDAVQCDPPDLVLLDVMMPELNGWEVCKVLRESSKGKAIPIIMLSALADEEARVKGLGLGADDYITKPFSIREVLLKVGRQIQRLREIKRFQAREQEQDTSLKYFVHELRNAMTVIGGYSSLALKKCDGPQYLKTIKSSAMHAYSLLNDVSLLSRLEKDGGVLTAKPVDINMIVDEVIEMFEEAARRNRVEFVIVNRASAPVSGNGTALRQVLFNLLSNAVKYNREGGKVVISFEETQERLDVSIADEGAGISPEELPRIFEKYYRASGSEKVKGTGLGLHIVKLLAGAMNGAVRAASSPCSGSVFTISLPSVRKALVGQ